MKQIFTFLIVMACVPVWAQEAGVLSGIISTTNVKPIPGATVRVLNTPIGTATNEAGEFTISGLTRAKYTLEISAVGYASVKKDVDLASNQESLRIQLVESVRQLDAVIVTAENYRSVYPTRGAGIRIGIRGSSSAPWQSGVTTACSA